MKHSFKFSQVGGAPDKTAGKVKWEVNTEKDTITVYERIDGKWASIGAQDVQSVDVPEQSFEDDELVLVRYKTKSGERKLVAEGPIWDNGSVYYKMKLISGEKVLDDTLLEEQPEIER